MSEACVGSGGPQATTDSIPGPRRRHRLPAPDKAGLRDMLRRLGLPEADAMAVDADAGVATWNVFQDGVLLREGDPAPPLYVVRSGMFKSTRVLEDGYEQVLSFALPGELLGSVALHGGRQPTTVTALQDSTVYALPLARLQALRASCPALDVALEQALSRQLVRTAEAAAMSAPVSSEVRLARFLLWLSQCMADAGQSPRRLLLRMGRRDIASLLCVAHETVSRGFTNLATVGYVLARRKEVEILDPEGLRDFARFTRGTPPDTLRRPVAGHAQAAPLPPDRLPGPLPAHWFSGMPSLGAPSDSPFPDRDQGSRALTRHAVVHAGETVP